MRIALIGQAAFGKDVLSALLDANENVVAALCPPDLPNPVSYTHLTLPTKA